MDWFDVSEEVRSPAAEGSRMRLYIAAGLIGFGALGLVGGLLHLPPA